jgi:hypothetical protein
MGMASVNHRRSPVVLKRKTTPDTVNPAETVSEVVNDLEIATAAIALTPLEGLISSTL